MCGVPFFIKGTGPYRMPLMPQLPSNRVSETNLFNQCGVDYFCPLYIKIDIKKGTKSVDLFIHMFSYKSNSSRTNDRHVNRTIFKRFGRFLPRCGKPKKITSDNASQFKLASETIDKRWGKIITERGVVTYVGNISIKWHFTAELAPWMGGFYWKINTTGKGVCQKSNLKLCFTYEKKEKPTHYSQ